MEIKLKKVFKKQKNVSKNNKKFGKISKPKLFLKLSKIFST